MLDLKTTALEWFYRSTSRAVWGFFFFSLSFSRAVHHDTYTTVLCRSTPSHSHTFIWPSPQKAITSVHILPLWIFTLAAHIYACLRICESAFMLVCVSAYIVSFFFSFLGLWCLFSQDTVWAHPFVFVCKTAGWVRLAVIYYNFTKAAFVPLALVWEVLLTVVGGKITGLIRAKNLISQHRGEDLKFISSCSRTFEDGFGVGSQTSYKVDPVEEILMKCFNQPRPPQSVRLARVSLPTNVFLKCLRDITKRAFHKTQESF